MRDFHAGNKSSGEYTGKSRESREWNPYIGEEEPAAGCCMERYERDGMREWRYGFGKLPELSEKEQNDVMRWNEALPEDVIMQKGKLPGSPEANVGWIGGETGSEGEVIMQGEKLPKSPEANVGWIGGETSSSEEVIMQREKLPESPGPVTRWNGQMPVPPMLVPERRSKPPRGTMPVQAGPEKRPEWEKQPPRGGQPVQPGPEKRPEWGKQPPRGGQPVQPGPEKRPEWGKQPPRGSLPVQPGPEKRPEWGKQPPRGGQPVQPGPERKPEWGKQPPRRPLQGSGRASLMEQHDQAVESRNGMSYIRYDYDDIIEEEKQTEKDLRMLQSMYPEAVKEILPCVEEICDRMEYEGSMMFDEYPDKNTVWRLSDEIYEQTGDVWPRETVQEPDGVMSMQYQGGGRGPLGELIQILLLQEMHHRRCRHRRCRQHMF